MTNRRHESDPVTVFVAQGEVEAQLVKQLLESRGIRTHFEGEALRYTHGLTMNGLGQVRIQVAPSQQEEALLVIGELERGELALGDDAPG